MIVWSCYGSVRTAWTASIDLPTGDPQHSVMVQAAHGHEWQEEGRQIWTLEGPVEIQHGAQRARCARAVLWIDPTSGANQTPRQVHAYLEGKVTIEGAPPSAANPKDSAANHRLKSGHWLARFATYHEVQVATRSLPARPEVDRTIYERALAAHQQQSQSTGIRLVQAVESLPTPQVLTEETLPGSRRIQIRQRSSTRNQIQYFPSPDGREQVAVVDGGVNVVVNGMDALGKVDISADRVVVWTSANALPNLNGEVTPTGDTPLELYLEGNIEFRQADRVIYACRLYYNVQRESGVVLDAEVLTPVQTYQGLIRLRADVIQQLNREQFVARDAAVTGSRLGEPRYWIESESITFQDRKTPVLDPYSGMVAVDPNTGDPLVNREQLVTGRNNFVYVGGVPIFYWPFLATDLTKPTLYLDRVAVKNDDVFGTQLLTDWDMFQLLGIAQPPEGTEWTSSFDYLSERGFGFGTNVEYDRSDFLGIEGPAKGVWDAWFIDDSGVDNLGLGRSPVPLDETFRGRVLGRHRQRLGNGFQFTGGVGYVSDRNFLEEYYEKEWDTEIEPTTSAEIKQFMGHKSWSVLAQGNVNDFYTQTQWLPRADHYTMGRALWGEQWTWYEHSQISYANLTVSDVSAPAVPDAGFPLPWEVESEGLRASTRQELDLPLFVGPVKVVPYVLGEVAYWGDDLLGSDSTRLFGQAGLRTSLPFWRADPTVQSDLWNLNGLAHKVMLESELFYADADRNFDTYPLYDPLDDLSQRAFRRRYPSDVFGAPPPVPLPFDERYFAFRSALQQWVASPSLEIVDDLTLIRFNVNQRWQTKRGRIGQQRTIDWISLDVGTSLFPEADRDNFGETVGLIDYDLRWHVGDRVTLLSDGFFDVFPDGLRTVSLGGFLTRPGQLRGYLGIRSIEGPITAQILSSSLEYRLSPKWITRSSSSIDLSDTGNIGQSYEITRVGESFLASLGFFVDHGRDNVGINFSLEPRFLSGSRRSQVAGLPIGPASLLSLE